MSEKIVCFDVPRRGTGCTPQVHVLAGQHACNQSICFETKKGSALAGRPFQNLAVARRAGEEATKPATTPDRRNIA